MGFFDLLIHVLNFLAPALGVAGGLAFVGLWGGKKGLALRAGRSSAGFHLAVNFAVGSAALLAGLVLFGRDGKMASYAAMVLAVASSQWVLLGGWRR